MFQFRAFPSYAYFIQRTIRRYCLRGFPHSEISGSMDICSSPKLIAAYHVFRRLSVPRHPPYALCSLTTVLIVRVRLAPFPYHLTFWFKVYVWFVWISCLLNIHSLMKLNWFHYLCLIFDDVYIQLLVCSYICSFQGAYPIIYNIWLSSSTIFLNSGAHLLSHAVSSIVSSAA